ncbi:hypothetical protein E2320_005027 [Naja naja]|nr:hypothetical protein E2320_005027 [Naja naja]
MGSSLSEEQRKHVDELGYLLKKNHNEVSQRSLIRLVQEIAARCLWYPEKGSLKLADWEKIGRTLHTGPRASVEALQVWHLCQHPIEKFGTAAISLLTPPPPCYTAPIVCPPSSSESMTITPSGPVDTGQHSHNPPVQSSFQKMVETCKRDALVTGSELAELLSVCPVRYHQGQGQQLGQQIAEWEGLPYQILRELKKAITDYCISGGCLKVSRMDIPWIPEDWEQVFRMILTSMQYVVWESEYLRHAQAVALGGGGAYTVEQLFGSGQFAAVPAQTVLPPATLAVVSECAYWAFLKVPQAGEPRANFSNIQQGANEPYADFVERLSKAIRQQFDHQEAAGELLRQLAIENANADCKRALQLFSDQPINLIVDTQYVYLAMQSLPYSYCALHLDVNLLALFLSLKNRLEE